MMLWWLGGLCLLMRRIVAQRQSPRQSAEPVAPEIDTIAFAARMAGINQGLATLN